MNVSKRGLWSSGAAGFAMLAFASGAVAQEAASPPQQSGANAQDAQQGDEVVVVGSRIRGASEKAALPVAVLRADEIAATGAVSGDDLMRTVPQMGDVLFNAANNPQTSNSARGDINSFNLRSLGVGNTLVLINGRRVVQHPASQGTSDTGVVPVLSYNSNAVPVSGLGRVEVLLEGASAIYGADAVAGVVNAVTRDDYEGLRASAQYGAAEGTSFSQSEYTLLAGKNFSRGNITAYLAYTDQTALKASDQDFTSTADLTRFFANEPGFNTSTVPNGASSFTPWANFAAPGAGAAIRIGTNQITSAAGAFHVQPASFGCTTNAVAIGGGVCIMRNNVSFSGAGNALRFDTQQGVTVLPSVHRLNFYSTGHYDLANGITAFGELGYYRADTHMVQPPVILLNSLWIPANNYWNPLGPTTLNGQPNSNRLAGLSNVPAAGLPVQLVRYRFVDTGLNWVHDDNYQLRFVTGLRGSVNDFDWEGALVYSNAQAEDISPNVNSTALQHQLSLSTPDAYNPFSGGCTTTPGVGDCTPSSQAAIDAILFNMRRMSHTSLAMADFKVSNANLFQLPGGAVGMAFGLEARKETQRDNRDSNLDGTNVFVDAVTGAITQSNVAAVSPNPDTYGRRTVSAAYLEFEVPLISPEMNIPLVRSVDLQIAGRYEHYSDFGGVAKPKIAGAWDITDGLRVRGSYSEGFRAPNLEQVNALQYARLATNNDYIRCEADIRAGRIADMNACTRSASVSLLVSGNPDLKPEESTNESYGIVFEPWFVPDSFGHFTFTADRWRIQQEKIVGLLGAQAALALDYFDILHGTTNPNVRRAAVNADDVALFAGTGIAPVGQVISVSDRFVNLLPQDVQGLDLSLRWTSPRTRFGKLDIAINAAELIKFSRDPGPVVDNLYAARAAGQINALTPLPNSADLVAKDGRPKWRISGSATWRNGPLQIGAFAQYISAVDETAFLDTSGNPWEIDSQLISNLYVQYDIDHAGWASDTRIRVGARNITDEQPPLTSTGYLGSLYRPYGRFWYVNLSKSF